MTEGTPRNGHPGGCHRERCGGLAGTMAAFDRLPPLAQRIVNAHPDKLCVCTALANVERTGERAAVQSMIERAAR